MITAIYFYLVILFSKLLFSFYNLLYVKRNLASFNRARNETTINKKNLVILIPVLREQNVIEGTLNHMFNMFCPSNVNLYIVVAGTIREKANGISTKEVVLGLKDKINSNLFFFEEDNFSGDRATQLNFAIEKFERVTRVKPDIIGVYDAESKPDTYTFDFVNSVFSSDPDLCACQQPVHFNDAANLFASKKSNPIIVANALFQSSWTIIKELPAWMKYYLHSIKKKTLYFRNIYFIGHGEFLTYEMYKKFKFPEYCVTDGIQLGYRLSMSNKRIKPLLIFCSDDVPDTVGKIIQQHKRWFGGCMQLCSAYKWSKNGFKTNAIFQVLDGFWSQLSWAFSAFITCYMLCASFSIPSKGYFCLVSIGVIIFCYIIPLLSHLLLPVKPKVRFIDWLCLPLAILLKAIGPNLYFFEQILCFLGLKRSIKYQKVER